MAICLKVGPAQTEPEVTSRLYGYVAHTFLSSFLTSSSCSAHNHDHIKDLLKPANQGRKACLGLRWTSLVWGYKSKMAAGVVSSMRGIIQDSGEGKSSHVQPLGQCTWSSTFCVKTSGLRKNSMGFPSHY